MSHPDTNLEDLLIAVKRQDRAAFDRQLKALQEGDMPSAKLPATRKPKWLKDLHHWISMEGLKQCLDI